MKKITLVGLAILALIPVSAIAEVYAWKWARNFHRPQCRLSREIPAAYIVKYDSPSQAKEAGYLPCPICNPK